MLGMLGAPTLAVMLFHRVLHRNERLSFDERVKTWEVFLKTLSAFTVIVSGAFMFGGYIDQIREKQAVEIRVMEAESQRAMLDQAKDEHEQHKELLLEAKRVAATVATEHRPGGIPTSSARQRFEELYFADLIGVEGPKVQHAMVELRGVLDDEPVDGEALSRALLQLSASVEEEVRASAKRLQERREIYHLAAG